MSEILGQYLNDYEDLYFCEKKNNYDIYSAYNLKEKREVSLKVIKKEENSDNKLILQKIKKEVDILKLCNDKNILNFHRYYATGKYFVIEQDWYETNMHEYIMNNGPSYYKKEFFKSFAIELAKALQVLHKKKVIHRNIKSSNVYLIEKKGTIEVKLGEFSRAILIKENTSEFLDSMYYAAPEIINGEKYNEKCDLWSFGIVLYDLYFGELPYGYKPSRIFIRNAVNVDNFNYKKTDIYSLDEIFEGLFKIKPEERLTHEQLFKLIFNSNFMNENIFKKKSSNELIEKLEDTMSSSFSENNEIDINNNGKNQIKIKSIIISHSDISSSKYNNIIYYDENISHYNALVRDCENLEKETPGTFILCRNIISLEIVIKEIINQRKINNNIIFNLISTGRTFDKVMKFLKSNNEYEKFFENICIYCFNIKKYEHFKETYKNEIKDNIYKEPKDIIHFIYRTSNSKISPFKINKLINYNFYVHNYIDKYNKLFKYYFELKDNIKYCQDMEKYINEMDKQKKLINDKKKLLEGFNNINKYKNIFDNSKLIIKEFINNIYNDLNNFLITSDIKFKECVEYYTAKIIYCFIYYLNQNNIYYNWNQKTIYMGTNLYLSELLQYERKTGKILFLNFVTFYENKDYAENISKRKDSINYFKKNLKFSVIFILEGINCKFNGINIQQLSIKKEKSIIFLPFTFFELKQIDFNFENYTADIYLETI